MGLVVAYGSGPLELEVSVDVDGLNDVFARFSARAVGQRNRQALEEMTRLLKQDIEDHTPHVTGATAGSISTQVSGQAVEVFGTVRSDLISGSVLEFGGRWPGAWPPRDPIEAWCESVLGDGKLWFVVARAIKNRGLPARHLFTDALVRFNSYAQDVMTKHFADL